jgi:hypothetical protein
LFLWGALSDERSGSVFCMCCWSLPAQSFPGSSFLGLATIFYCPKFQTSLSQSAGVQVKVTLRLTVSQSVSLAVERSLSRARVPWDLWPYFTVSDLRRPFSRLLRLARSRWRYSTPPAHGCYSVNLVIVPSRGPHRKHGLCWRNMLTARCLAIDVWYCCNTSSWRLLTGPSHGSGMHFACCWPRIFLRGNVFT